MNKADSQDQPSQRRIHPIVVASYYPRVLTWAFAGMMYASAVHARFPALAWTLVAFGIVWPQAVHLIALRSRDTRRAGFVILSGDTILFGACVGATGLDPVAAVTATGFVGTTLLTMGGVRLLAKNLPLYLLSVGVGLYFAGFDPQLRPEPLTFALAAVVLIVYTWSLGYFVNDTGKKAIAAGMTWRTPIARWPSRPRGWPARSPKSRRSMTLRGPRIRRSIWMKSPASSCSDCATCWISIRWASASSTNRAGD
jgi:hypothetical protein